MAPSEQDCPICHKTHEDLRDCPKKKGCSKCKEAKDHTPSQCDKPYPRYDEQVCDNCLKEHMPGECKESIENPCKGCGHLDHRQNACILVPPKTKLVDVEPEKAMTFTPKSWEKYCAQMKKIGREISTSASSSKNASDSTTQTEQAPEIGDSSNPSGGGTPQEERTLSKEEIKAEEQRRWDDAARNVPERPKEKDTRSARTTEIQGNFFEVTLSEKVPLHRYSISFIDKSPRPPRIIGTAAPQQPQQPKVKRETKRYLVEQLFSNRPPPNPKWATDYDSTIISAGPLYKHLASVVGEVTDPETHGQSGNVGDLNSKWKLSINFLGFVDVRGVKKYVKDGTVPDNLNDNMKALNIITWKKINDPSFVGGRVGNKFYPETLVNRGTESGEKARSQLFRIREGFFSSIRLGENKLLLNVNTATSAFYAPINLQSWMEICWKSHRPSLRQFLAKLKDVRVTVDMHDRGAKRAWVICGLSENSVYETTFEQDGKFIRVWQYLKGKYPGKYPGRNVTNSQESFCINVGSQSRPTWFPADHLTIMDWQILKEKVPDTMSDDMIAVACKRPQVNKQKILGGGLSQLGINPLATSYSDFGMTVLPQFIKFTPPEPFKPPKLSFHAVGDTKKDSKGFASMTKPAEWFLTGHKFCNISQATPLINVLWLSAQDGGLKRSLSEIYSQLRSFGFGGNLRLESLPRDCQPPTEDPRLSYRDRCLATFREAYDPEAKPAPQRPSLLLVILSEKDRTLYPEVKRWADCVVGIPSVCITSKKLQAAEKDFNCRANICLKINSKLNGVSHRIQPFHEKWGIGEGYLRTMIVGADVTHPGKAGDGCPSMAGVVATVDDFSNQYLASARLQKSKQEKISDLKGMMIERIIAWYDRSPGETDFKKRLPAYFLFYRDGVSESQYGMVLDEEVPQIKEAFVEVLAMIKRGGKRIPKNATWEPKLTVIIVTKRHHARFYPVSSGEPGSKEDVNLEAGTVVDSVVMPKNHFSFYLQSHHSKEATARSAYYVVLLNEGNYTCSKLEKITHDICYTGSRATKALSVCTPARYADILCDRLRCYMKSALDNTYTPGDTLPSLSPPSTPALNLGDLDWIARVPHYEKDGHIWKINSDADPDRKNPWHRNMDGIMFYL